MAGAEAIRSERGSPRPAALKRWLVAIGLLAAVVICVGRFPAPLHTLEHFTDHLHHEYAAWSFLQIGTHIWSEPLQDWDVSARFVHELWLTVPHAYPPGNVVLFLPFGAAANLGLVSDATAHMLLVVLFGAAAIAAAVALWLALRPAYPPALAGVVAALASIELLHWGLNGFLDPLAVFVALVGILLLQRERPASAVLMLALALSMHFRLWYLLPVIVAAMVDYRRLDVRTGIASAILGLSALPLLPLWPFLGELRTTPGFGPNPLYGEVAAALIAAALIGLVAITERRAVPAVTTAAAALMMLLNPQWQPWYAIAFLPLLPLVRTVPAQAALTFAWVQVALLSPQGLDLSSLIRWLGQGLRI